MQSSCLMEPANLETRADGDDAPVARLVQRMDVGHRLAKATITPQGGVEVDGVLGKPGVLVYRDKDGQERREYYSPDEAKREDSLATLETAPVTLRHPPVLIDRDNFRRYSRGVVKAPRYDEGVAAKLVIQDGELIDGIDSGELGELSLGYRCKITYKPGVAPDGQRYDAVQTDRVYNHVGIGPMGWARSRDARGPSSLRLDGDDNLTFHEDGAEASMKITFNGAEYDLEVPAHLAAFKEAEKALREDGEKARKERDEARGRADGLETKVKELEGSLAKAVDPEVVAKAAAELATVQNEARQIAPAVKLDGLNKPRAIQQAALEAADKTVKLDGETDDYVRGQFKAALKNIPKTRREDGVDRVRRAAVGLPEERADGDQDEDRADAVEASTSFDARLRKLSQRKDPRRMDSSDEEDDQAQA